MAKSAFTRACVVTTVALATFVASLSASHSWGGYHWAREQNPVSLLVGTNLTGQWPQYLSTAVNLWDQSPVLSLQIVAGSSNRRCKPKAGRRPFSVKKRSFVAMTKSSTSDVWLPSISRMLLSGASLRSVIRRRGTRSRRSDMRRPVGSTRMQ